MATDFHGFPRIGSRQPLSFSVVASARRGDCDLCPLCVLCGRKQKITTEDTKIHKVQLCKPETNQGKALESSRNSGCSSGQLCASGGISSGWRQSSDEARPAWIQAKRVINEPTTDDMAAHRRRELLRERPANALKMRNAAGTGPDNAPPMRVIVPLFPCFKGSR